MASQCDLHVAGENYDFSETFTRRNGNIFCEKINVNTIKADLCRKWPKCSSSFFVFSKQQLIKNISDYKRALEDNELPYMVGFSIKANYNPAILKILHEEGCTAVAVSGNEIELAIRVGIDPEKIVYNGNGKLDWEIELAVRHGCLLNVDSSFDLQNAIKAADKLKKVANVIIRLNPDIDPNVHPYVATGLAKSKFGVEDRHLPDILATIKHTQSVSLVGLHCHLGSTIETTNVFSECLDVMLNLVKQVKAQGFDTIRYLNLGGGLGIDYQCHSSNTKPPSRDASVQQERKFPVQSELIGAVAARVQESGLTLILEPGRSLVGNTCIFVCDVIGWKKNGPKNYLIVDGSMNEIIRPSLYGSYHHIELTEPTLSSCGPNEGTAKGAAGKRMFDVVGPVCESADFLGKDRWLDVPHTGCGVAVFDTGAYCASMAGNYNMRGRPAEILVDNNSWKIIREPETLDGILGQMKF